MSPWVCATSPSPCATSPPRSGTWPLGLRGSGSAKVTRGPRRHGSRHEGRRGTGEHRDPQPGQGAGDQGAAGTHGEFPPPCPVGARTTALHTWVSRGGVAVCPAPGTRVTPSPPPTHPMKGTAWGWRGPRGAGAVSQLQDPSPGALRSTGHPRPRVPVVPPCHLPPPQVSPWPSLSLSDLFAVWACCSSRQQSGSPYPKKYLRGITSAGRPGRDPQPR